MHILKVVTSKPPTLEQLCIKSIQAQVKQEHQSVKAERIRQQQVKPNQQRSILVSV